MSSRTPILSTGVRALLWLAAAAAPLLLAGCGRKPTSTEQLGVATAALSTTMTRTYGFESLSDWSAIYSSPTLALSNTHLEGSKSLAVSGGGWSSVVSRTLAKEESPPTIVGFDLMIPSPQPNPDWYGTITFFIDVPSVGINNQPLGTQDLKQWTPGTWRRAEFNVPSSIQSALGGTYSDLRFRIELNRPTNATAGYLVDRLSWSHIGTGCMPTSDGSACTVDMCDANGQQAHVPVAAGTSCADNTVCNGAETCNATGTCVAGTPVALSDGNPCTVDSCNATTGAVAHTNAPAGSSCSDANACNGAETCNASGSCLAGVPPTLNDGNPCTVDTCSTGLGVTHTPVASGTSCADGNACNGAETCSAVGVCASGTPPIVNDNNPCTTDVCNTSTGAITHALVAPGTSCSDGNACNGAETCGTSGSCQAGTPPSLNDNNPCTTDSCNSSTGAISHTPIAPGGSCSDGNACNGAEKCSASGVCLPGAAPALDDHNPCTIDTCNSATGVAHTLAAAGASCSDGNPCNGAETCNGNGHCLFGVPPSLSDGNPCTHDTCNPVAGIQHTPKPAGTICLDGNKCDGFEKCDAGGHCVRGAPPPIDDGNSCTIDSCSPFFGVKHVPASAGTPCNDGIACNGNETCDADGICVAGASTGTCVTNVCQNRTLRIVDVQGDLRDIWAGREQPATGKRSSASPVVTLEFNAPVDPELVVGAFIGQTHGTPQSPQACDGTTADVLHSTPLRVAIPRADVWRTSLIPDAALEHVPLDFSLLAFGDVAGSIVAEGPIAIGGKASLSNVQVNQVAHAPVGLAITGKLSAATGNVFGDLDYGSPGALPAAAYITVSGQKQIAQPVPFSRLYPRLTDFGRALAERTPNGRVQRVGSQLRLDGQDLGVNVFSLDSSAFAGIASTRVSIPANASAVINVAGRNLSLPGPVSFVGTDASHVLWNLPDAAHLTIAGSTFSGSVLAPASAVNLQTPEFFGTLVAGAVSTSTTFRRRPLTVWASLGKTSDTTSVTLTSSTPLAAGCEYHLTVDPAPASDGGSCLGSRFDVAFRVADGDGEAFGRELGSRRFDPRRQSPTAFRSRPGINTRIDDFFGRYAAEFGLRKGLDDLIRLDQGGRSPTSGSRETAYFQQRYRGVPVEGGGYLLHHEDEVFRFASGHLLPNIALDVAPTVSGGAALSAALAYANPHLLPWNASPPLAPPPSVALRIRATGPVAAPVPTLVWRVTFQGIAEAMYVDVDAADGHVLFAAPGRIGVLPPIACSGFNETAVTYAGSEQIDVSVPLNGASGSVARSDLDIGIWTQGTTTHHAFRGKVPFLHRTTYVDLTVSGLSSANLFTSTNFIPYACVTNGNDASDQVAAVQWSLQAAGDAFSILEFGGDPWIGMTGSAADRMVTAQLELTAPRAGCSPTTGECDSQIVSDNLLTTGYAPWFTPPSEELIQVEVKDLDFPSISHEFGHGVLWNARYQAGAPGFEFDGESGALNEAFGDIMASVATLRELPDEDDADPWCIPLSTLHDGGCARNLAVPKHSDPPAAPHPDTYGGSYWDNCSNGCDIHVDATVAGHWFYLLVEGQDASVPNDVGCAVSVPPIPVEQAAQIAFAAYSMFPADVTFKDARDMTIQVAEDIYDKEVAQSVAQAWLAVGVGEAPEPSGLLPEPDDTDVEPWGVTFQWDVGEQVGPWVMRYAMNEDFSDAIEVDIGHSFDADGRRVAAVGFDIEANKRYYWQGREGTADGDADAWKCAAFVTSFKTKKKSTHLVEPAEPTGAFYQLDPYGQISWERTKGAASFDINITDDESDCDGPGSTAVPSNRKPGANPSALIGDIEQNSQFRLPFLNNTFLREDLVFEPDHTYYFNIRPTSLTGLPGTCSHFPFRGTYLRPFTQIAPVPAPDIPTLEYGKGGPFVFTPSDGADRYTISLIRIPPGGALEYLPVQELAASDVQEIDGYLSFTLPDISPTVLSGQLFWNVDAWSGPFSRKGLLPADPPDAITVTPPQFFASAAETWAFYGPDSGLCSSGSTGSLDPMVVGETDCAQTFVGLSPDDHPLHEGATCVVAESNTAGAYWWLGPANHEGPIDPAEVHDTFRDPPDNPCVGPDYLDVSSDEDLVLLVAPYSVAYVDGPHGFGPQHRFNLRVLPDDLPDAPEPPCGARNDVCCQRAAPCDFGSNCYQGRCVECGRDNEHACDDGLCANADRPRYMDQINFCRPCGFPGEPCCPEDSVAGQDCPDSDVYGQPVKLCNRAACEICGQVNMACCNGACPYSEPDVTCQGRISDTSGGVCVRNSPSNSNDNPNALPCNAPIPLAGHAQGGTFDVRIGAKKGHFKVTFNTYNVADAFEIDENGVPLAGILCVGTQQQGAGTFPSIDGNLSYSCGANGICTVEVPFDGNTDVVQVDVIPRCAEPDGKTDWDITLSCAY